MQCTAQANYALDGSGPAASRHPTYEKQVMPTQKELMFKFQLYVIRGVVKMVDKFID